MAHLPANFHNAGQLPAAVLTSGVHQVGRQSLASARAVGGSARAYTTTTREIALQTHQVPIHPLLGATMSDPGEAGGSQQSACDVTALYTALNEYLLMEGKFQPRLCLTNESENGDVTRGARDGAAHVLRSLKVWFDLPVEVFIDSINLLDRFLTKMKVRPCHVPCITVSCINIAIEDYAANNNIKRTVTIEDLVSISQWACTAGDVSRMSGVVRDKLRSAARRLTPLQALGIYARLLHAATGLELVQESELTNLLEIVVCDAECANIRMCELALVILYHKIEERLLEWSRTSALPDEVYYVYEFAAHMQQYCNMSESSLASAKACVKEVIRRYEARQAQPQRQRLVWRLSERTLKVLRPTDRLTSLLPTIEEQHHIATDVTPPRNRSGSESSVSEETCDWPRSPVLPVYCNN